MSVAQREGGMGIRRLSLSGAVNFRDLGGYPTVDGRRTRWGMLFRSDQLAELDDADLETLAGLGLRTICDLRAESEREHKPNRRLRDPHPQVHALGFMPHNGDALLADARSGSVSVEEIEARVREIYRRFVTDQTQAYSRLLHVLDERSVPLLIHCTSGRDRTGFASAVVMMALGVTRSTIAEDYALSNQYRRDLTFQVGGAVDPVVMAALTQSHPAYLAEAFQTIDEVWGSDDAYLCDALELSDERREALKDLLLEPAP